MAANSAGLPGALFDPDATQAQGALCTGIGIGINSVMGPPDVDLSWAAGNIATAQRIGGGSQALFACGFPGKGLTFRTNTSGAAVADGAAMPGGAGTDLNHSGKPCPVLGQLWAVAP